MIWRIKVHRDAAKQLEAIPPDRRERILNDFESLLKILFAVS
jgi:mRNA-degrading endonuclease RelE of RelBE toxin-antitoxin system